MSLISLSIIGKDNEPLYLRDFQLVPNDTTNETKEETNEEKKEDDFFGFFNCNKLAGESSSLRHQVGILQRSLVRYLLKWYLYSFYSMQH